VNNSACRIVVVIPAYNEAFTLREIATEVLAHVSQVIVIDDGSSDGSAATVNELPVQIIRHEKNLGKSRSLVDGFHAALALGADAVVTLDADGQHRPQDLPRLLEESTRNPLSIVIGSRLHDKAGIPATRYCANRFANFWIAWAAGYPIKDSQSGFRIYPAALLIDLPKHMQSLKGFVFESEILIHAGARGIFSRAVPIPAIYAAVRRQSHFRPILDIAPIVFMVTRRLLARGMHLRGLMMSLNLLKPPTAEERQNIG
jgi:glycosyltransferase involved in cell wall biosynthesis